MDIYEEIKVWLAGRGLLPVIDGCHHPAGSTGLFPQGVQELRSWEDVVGNRYRKVRYRFLLRLVAPPGEEAARLLLRIQAEAPQAGISATDGTMKKPGSDGLAVYEIRLSTEREEKL